jgi:diadenylate cyclase
MLKMLFDLRFLDLVDILILTFIFYRIYRLFKGTRALQVLKGLSILIITLLIAQIAHLQTINWILKNFWAIWIVALIVIFQPELRRALARSARVAPGSCSFRRESPFPLILPGRGKVY